MEAYLLDWAQLLLRWLHVITAIAWVGSSFYFVMLDNSLTPPHDDDLKARGVDGELWAVHGGGFYNPQKYLVGPRRMPPGKLHWFYWESYTTWMSGVALFTLLYLLDPGAMLIDRRVFEWPPALAVAAALAFLVGGWLVYDAICRVAGRTRDGAVGGNARVLALIFVCISGATWLACQLFAGRAAFLLIGATLATIMSANVLVWIIPGQRKVVAALTRGQQPDPLHGQRGKQRSVHNTYFALPVLVAMLSNHYGMLYQDRWNWLALMGLMLAGALIRQFFVARHRGPAPWGLVVLGVALIAGVAALLAPQRTPADAGASLTRADFAQVQAIVARRCVMCHNAQLANKNVRLDSPAAIVQHAQMLYAKAVLAKTMPLNNATQITEAERALLGAWVRAGAVVDGALDPGARGH